MEASIFRRYLGSTVIRGIVVENVDIWTDPQLLAISMSRERSIATSKLSVPSVTCCTAKQGGYLCFYSEFTGAGLEAGDGYWCGPVLQLGKSVH